MKKNMYICNWEKSLEYAMRRIFGVDRVTDLITLNI